MDRQLQATDPMLIAARAVMVDLIQHAAEGSTVLLCRLFHDRVMCMHQVMGRGPQAPVSYERGRLMPLYRGATAKIILAHLPTRTLKSLYAHRRRRDHRSRPRQERRRVSATRSRRCGAPASASRTARSITAASASAAPIFDRDRAVLGSLSFALPDARADEALIERLKPLTAAGAREIERIMSKGSGTSSAKPGPSKNRTLSNASPSPGRTP